MNEVGLQFTKKPHTLWFKSILPFQYLTLWYYVLRWNDFWALVYKYMAVCCGLWSIKFSKQQQQNKKTMMKHLLLIYAFVFWCEFTQSSSTKEGEGKRLQEEVTNWVQNTALIINQSLTIQNVAWINCGKVRGCLWTGWLWST